MKKWVESFLLTLPKPCCDAKCEKAASKGDADAQVQLGLHLGILDYRGITWIRKAADQNHAEAQAYLGICCFYYREYISAKKNV